ncbi:MAG: hypothetical protein U0768_22275 [Anaerolineae bacterium]
MDNPILSEFPPDLAARLQAAGVTDLSTLNEALADDQALSDDVQAFLEANPNVRMLLTMSLLLEAFLTCDDEADLVDFWQRIPEELEQPFLESVEGLIEGLRESGDDEPAEMLQERYEALKDVVEDFNSEEPDLPPVAHALFDFINATSDDAAARVFDEQRALLQTTEAQDLLDDSFRSDNPAGQERLAERRTLLRALRSASSN